MFIREQLEKIPLPQLKRVQEDITFKLSVRAVAASAPALPKPGVFSRSRPRLEVTLGDVMKTTEFGDYEEGGSTSSVTGALSTQECPWRFGDTLTFKASMKDIHGPGLKIRLRACSDFALGPVQLQMSQVAELGEANLDLRRRVLPGCMSNALKTVESWASSIQLVPLNHVKGGLVAEGQALGQAVGHIAVSFVVDTDPEDILALLEAEARTVSDMVAAEAKTVSDMVAIKADGFADELLRWFNPQEPDEDPVDKAAMQPGGGLRTLTPGEALAASDRAKTRRSKVKAVEEALPDPEFEPEGWISRKGPNGRYHWHHRSLGPAPWEADETLLQETLPTPTRSDQLPDARGLPSRSARSTSFGPISSQLPEGNWISHQGPNGQTFWHNTALGPAPWQQASGRSSPGGSKLASLPEGTSFESL